MISRMTRIAAALALFLLVVLPAWADEPDPARLAQDLVAEDADVRRAAREGIDALGPRAVPALLDAMKAAPDKSRYVDKLFGWNLAPYAERGGPVFARMLEKDRGNHKLILLLERIGPDGVRAFPLFEMILRDPERSAFVRATAAVSLLRGGHPAKRVIEGLRLSKGSSVFGVMTFTEALVMAAEEEPEAVRRLTALPFVVDGAALECVFAAVAMLGAKGEAAGPRLRALLASTTPGPRLLAAATLLRIGVDTDAAFRVLEEASKAENHETAMRFGDAMRVAIAPETIERLAPLLDAPAAYRTAHKIGWAVARLGARAKRAVGALRRWLTDRHAGEYGLLALGHVGRDAAPQQDAFIYLVQNGSAWQRAVGATCLLRINPADRDARAALDAAAPEVEAGDRRHLARVLGAAGADVPHVAPHLARLMADGRQDVRALAVIGFANVGAAGAKYVDVLFKALDDVSPTVRHHAAFALSRVRPEGPASKDEAAALTKHLSNPHWAVRAWAAILLTREPHKRELGPALEPVLRYASVLRPAWRKPADTYYTWEPNFEAELREAARAATAPR